MRQSQLLASTILSAVTLSLSTVAYAQVAGVQPPQPSDDPQTATEVGEVVVTGTRLRLQDYAAPNPVTTVTAENIEASGQTNLTQFLTDIPALTGSLTLEQGADTTTPGLAGLNLLNLRNLGASRTLVLVDGRRHVAANPGTSSVDVNTIPLALVERVEVLTGGASAVYGADGVSGVVNFILKDDFEGVDLRAQGGWSDGGGGDSTLFSAVVGSNFFSGRGNVTLAYEFAEEKALEFNERAFSRSGQRQIIISNPDDPGTFNADDDDPSIYDLILTNNVRYIDTSRAGSTYTNFSTASTTSGVSFTNNQPFVDGVYAGEFFMIGGSGTPLDDFNDDLLPNLKRNTANLNGRFDLTERVNLFGELKFSRTETQFAAQPSYFYGLFLHDENPFIPANVLADAQAPGGLANPADTFLPEPGVLLARDNFDLGTQNYDLTRDTWRGSLGVEGSLTDNINFEASYTYGKSEQTQDSHDVIINDRVFAATDVVVGPGGAPVCRSNLDPGAEPYGDLFAQFGFPSAAFGATFTPGAASGCLPLNLYGENQNSAAAVDWVTGDFTSSAEIDQHVFNAFISGDTAGRFELPAGPVAFVIGGEYRRESSDSIPEDVAVLAEDLEYTLTGVGRAVRTTGSFDVKEVFAEVSIPVLRDMPLADNVTIGAAYRYSDYGSDEVDTIDYQTDTWNVNARWAFNDVIAVRGAVARAVRAPNIVNLFQARQQTFESIADPCSTSNVNTGNDPATRRANCRTDLLALGVNPDTFINNSSEAIGGFISGNTALSPETADTWTLGMVLTPGFLPGLSASLDYYNIEIKDAITSYAAQTIVNNCYDLPRPNLFCDLIERGTSGGNVGRITTFEQQPNNISTFRTSGFDLTVRYGSELQHLGLGDGGLGRLDVTFVGNVLQTLENEQALGAPLVDLVNREGSPEYQASLDVTWSRDNLSVNYGYAWFNAVQRYSLQSRVNDRDLIEPRYLKYAAKSVHDLQVRYELNDAFSIYAGVNNFTDQQPEASSYNYPVSSLGRFFYVGANASLESLGGALFGR
jgi:outer membrane receptor protein involved in Fe transport